MIYRKAFQTVHVYKLMLAALFCICAGSASAQQIESADKIISVVGRNKIILQSDLDKEVEQYKAQDPTFNESSTCLLLQQMIMKKLLMEQAERDSVLVTDEDVDGQLDNRLRYFVQMYGSKEKLEQASGKTIYQIKEDGREGIREQLVAEKMQNQILQNVKITPAEVEAFYKKIPVDSLPFYPAAVEVGQIVIAPPVSPELDEYALLKVKEIRQDIIDGKKTFETAAGTESDDPGSRDNGGDLGSISRSDVVPEFAAAAFKLQEGEISQPVKTKFGYHIIQMVKREGDQVHVRHILIRPEVTSADYRKALDKLDSVRSELISGKTTFPEAVGKYSTDEAAKRTGGMIADPQTGNTLLDINKLDAGMVIMLDSMKPGSFSQPHVFLTETHEKSCRIVFLKSRTSPHKANLKDDYSKIQDVALQQKKSQRMQQWMVEKVPTYYLSVDDEYKNCGVIRDWIISTESANK